MTKEEAEAVIESLEKHLPEIARQAKWKVNPLGAMFEDMKDGAKLSDIFGSPFGSPFGKRGGL